MKYSKKKSINTTFDDSKEQEAVINDKFSKLLKRLKIATASVFIGGVGVVSAFPLSYLVYSSNNRNFNYNTVMANLEYYGGADFLINRNYEQAILQQSTMVNHLKATKDGVVKIGLDQSIPQKIVEAFKESTDYLNKIFSVINPKYSFKVGNYKESNCDIWVRQTNEDAKYTAQTHFSYQRAFSFCQRDISIDYANNSYSYEKSVHKLCILHEFLHILLGCNDIFDQETDYISLFSYTDVDTIGNFFEISQYYARKNNDAETFEKYDNFTSYMPVDLATLISVYGDSSKKENIKKYEELLKECMTNCRDVLGFRDYYKYTNSVQWLKELDSIQSDTSELSKV